MSIKIAKRGKCKIVNSSIQKEPRDKKTMQSSKKRGQKVHLMWIFRDQQLMSHLCKFITSASNL